MAKIPRELNCFGVGSLLSEKSEVFYSALPNTRSLGRVSDLIAAKLNQMGQGPSDELRFRALLLFGVFEALQHQATGQILTIECGIDDEDIAIGVAFQYSSGDDPDSSIEILAQSLSRYCERVVIRSQKNQRRFEIISLMSIVFDENDDVSKSESEIIHVHLDQDALKPSPVSASYTQLGDLDYHSLLHEQKLKAVQEEPEGQTLLKGLSEIEMLRKISGKSAPDFSDARIISGHAENEERIIVKGSQQELGSEEYRIKAGSAESIQLKRYEDRIAELETELRVLTGKRGSGDIHDQAVTRVGGFKEVIQKIWPFKKRTDGADEAERESVSKSASDESPVLEATVSLEMRETPASELQADVVDAAEVASKLLKELRLGEFHSMLQKVQKEVFQKPDTTTKTKNFIEGLMSELVSERSKLVDCAQQLNASVRHKEFEFKNKETALREEVRRLTDMVRQKNHSLSRTKDQLTDALATLEKNKPTAPIGESDPRFKQRIAMTQKLLAAAKKENQTMAERIEELKKQLTNAMMSKNRNSSSTELAALQQKYQQLQRQAEEFRKSNQNLFNKINERKSKIEAEGNAAMSKRLEAAMKLAVSNKREAEALREEVERLKAELKEALEGSDSDSGESQPAA